MATSEIMTIAVDFHMSHYRDVKNYLPRHVSALYKDCLGDLSSDTTQKL